MRKHLLCLISTVALTANAQHESGCWMAADVDYALTSRWGVDAGIGARIEDDGSKFTRYDAAFGVDYRLSKWLKIGVGYDFIRDYSMAEDPQLVYKKDADNPDGIRYDSNGYPVVKGYNYDDAYWRTKHRFCVDLTEKWKWGRFGFSLRERYQWTYGMAVKGVSYKYREELEEDDLPDYTRPYLGPYYDGYGDPYWYGLDEVGDKRGKTKHYFRTRLGVEYNIKNVPATPFVSYEIANDLGEAFSVVRHRVEAGVDVRMSSNKRNYLSLSYIYQHGAQEEWGSNDMHIISFGYKYKFSTKKARADKKKKSKAKL